MSIEKGKKDLGEDKEDSSKRSSVLEVTLS